MVVSSQLQSELLTKDISTKSCTKKDTEHKHTVEGAIRKRPVHKLPNESEMEEIPSRPITEDRYDRDVDLFDCSVD